MAAARRYTPGLATPADLATMLDRMGMDHAVVVQPSPYGSDHSCLIDGLTAMAGRCVGVASFGPGARPDAALLRRLDAAGTRGLRAHLLLLGANEAGQVVREAAALAREMSWHLELQIGAGQLGLVEQAARLHPGAIVLDHMARVGRADIPRLAAIPAAHVKLSGLYRHDDPGEALAVARALIEAIPERCLWGSDWPHTPPHVGGPAARAPAPFRAADAGADLSAVLGAAGAATRRAMLRDTPAALYTGATHRHERAAQ